MPEIFAIYTQAVYFPKSEITPSKAQLGKTTIGDIGFVMRHLLKSPAVDTTIIPFATTGALKNQFFHDFPGLTFSLKKFSSRDISLITPTLGYSSRNLPSELHRFDGINSDLYDLMAIMPELSEQVQKLRINYYNYFSDYVDETGVKDFAVKFYLSISSGIHKYGSLIKNSIGANYKKDINGHILSELTGDYLEFSISNDNDLEDMIDNIIYYMLKYDCIAAVNEGKVVKTDNDPSTKYALIASSKSLYDANFLFLSDDYTPSANIKNNGLSLKAINLYKTLFGVNLADLYDNKPNLYSSILDNGFIYSPYLMKNSHLFRQLFRPRTIEDLRDDYVSI